MDGYSTTIFPHESNKYYGHLGYSGDKETFKKFAFDYIDIATDLIDKRSNKILEKLDKKLKE